jgi:hypothetical protein
MRVVIAGADEVVKALEELGGLEFPSSADEQEVTHLGRARGPALPRRGMNHFAEQFEPATQRELVAERAEKQVVNRRLECPLLEVV